MMIKLTELTQELTEEGKEKLQRLLLLQSGVAPEEEEDEWERMGLPNPNKSSKSEKGTSDELIEYVDYNMVEQILFVRPSKVEAVLEYKDGSEVFMESGTSFIVKEGAIAVNELIES